MWSDIRVNASVGSGPIYCQLGQCWPQGYVMGWVIRAVYVPTAQVLRAVTLRAASDARGRPAFAFAFAAAVRMREQGSAPRRYGGRGVACRAARPVARSASERERCGEMKCAAEGCVGLGCWCPRVLCRGRCGVRPAACASSASAPGRSAMRHRAACSFAGCVGIVGGEGLQHLCLHGLVPTAFFLDHLH